MTTRKLTRDEIMQKHMPDGITCEIWLCGRDLRFEKRFPQPHVPSSECPFCEASADLSDRSSCGKSPFYTVIFTKCINYDAGPPMEYDIATRRLQSRGAGPSFPGVRRSTPSPHAPVDDALWAFAAKLPDDL